MLHTPNLNKLEATVLAIGANPTISYQLREAGDPTGFFTVTYRIGDDFRCVIGQGDTLADALTAARADAIALTVKVDISDLEQVAA